ELAALTGPIPTRAVKSRPPTLRVLGLVDCGLTGDAVATLCRLPALHGLAWLDLSKNDLGDAGALAIAAAPWERLAGLRLYNARVRPEGMRALAAAPSLARLRHLDLQDNAFGDVGVRAIAESPHLGALDRLNING